MSFSTDDPDLPDSIIMAVSGKKIYMDTSIEGIACKVLIDGDKGKGYIIIPTLRVYCELPDEMSEGLSMDDFVIDNIDGCVSIQDSVVSLSGRECKSEKYIFSDGRERTFYFYNGNLVRMDMLVDSETTVYNINSISSEVDESCFRTPKGYLKVNLSWLESQGFEG